MKMQALNQKVENANVLRWILLGALVTTLYFNAKIQDPFNSPKFCFLLVITAWLLGHISNNLVHIKRIKNIKLFSLILILFTSSMLVSAFFTDIKFNAFIGETQRKNGWLFYFALSILSLASAVFIRATNAFKIHYIGFVTGLVLAVYGLMQISGLDFVQWNNPYNAIISTVGNPNFAAAIMAMMASVIFGVVLNTSYNKVFRLSSLILTFVLIYTIYLSDARQGLISVAIGIGVCLLIVGYQKNRILGHGLAFSGATVGVLSILGMLQIGPLTQFLYKPSVTVRGYYWRAGIEMLKDHPFTGVGLDRYGSYFKQYRESTYPLKYGFDITSTNAHNVPIQIFATAGLLAGIIYLMMILFILSRGVQTIRRTDGNEKLLATGIFASWLAYQAQSIISIDNIGISVWGWLLGGAVIGLSVAKSDVEKEPGSIKSKKAKNQINLKQAVTSGSFALIALIFSVLLLRTESEMFKQRMVFNPQASENRSPLHEAALKTLKLPLLDPNYAYQSASNLLSTGFTDEGLAELKKLNEKDPRNLEVLNYLAAFNEYNSNYMSAIPYRIKISQLDPWNSKNYLQLGRNYQATGNSAGMKSALEAILAFDTISTEAKNAKIEFAS